MTAVRAVVHLARADFLERVRRYSFLVLLGLTVYLGYLFVPPVDAAYQTVALGDARGVYNSAWMGAMYGLMISSLVTLIAFYPIKNTVARDRETRVGQIVAATPVRTAGYTIGKWLSNLALLTLLLGVMTGMAVVMQWVRAEELRVDLLALVVPLWLIAFPPLSLVAAVAVLFECTPVLRGGVGNVAYFFLFMAVLVGSIAQADGVIMSAVNDPFGIAYVISDMQRTVIAHNPDYSGQVAIGGTALSADPLIFGWEGMIWTPAMIAARLSWVGVAFLLALVAALPFDRFDPARGRVRRRRVDKAESEAVPTLGPRRPEAVGRTATQPGEEAPRASGGASSRFPVGTTWVGHGGGRLAPSLGRVLLAELRLVLYARRWWWFAVLVALNAAGVAVPAAATPGFPLRAYLFAAAWFWPITAWSAMGSREQRHNTRQIVFAVPRPVGRQLFAAWLAGVCVTALAGLGFAAFRLFAGQSSALAAWVAGTLFIPSLALALGVWTGSRRAFEVLYTFLWYVGPLNRVPALDYMGVTSEAMAGGVSRYFLLASALLLLLAFLGRWRQVRR